MINQLISRLSRLLPAPGNAEAAPAAIHEDSNWHSSSFELARGLEVIEHRSAAHAVSADTLPAFPGPGMICGPTIESASQPWSKQSGAASS